MSAVPSLTVGALEPRQFLRFVAEHARYYAERARRQGDDEAVEVLTTFADVAERHITKRGRLALLGSDTRDAVAQK